MRIAFCLDQRLCSEKAHPKYAFFMCYALATIGNDVTLYAKGDTENAYEYFGLPPLPNLHIKSISRQMKGPISVKLPPKFVFRYWVAFDTMMRNLYDFVLVSEIKIAKFLTRLRKLRNVPLFFDVHDSKAIAKGAPDENEAWLFSRVDGIITTTEALRAFLERTYSLSKPSRAIPLGTLPSPVHLGPFEPEKVKTWNLFYVGSIHPRKGVELAVKSAKKVSERGIDLQLHVVGPDYGGLTSLLELVKAEKADKIFNYHGYVPPKGLKEFLLKANPHIFILPVHDRESAYTGSMKAIEYLKYGRPIVAVYRPGIAEVLIDNYNALLVKEPNADVMAEAIEKIITNGSFARSLAYNAFESSQRYTYEARALALLDFVKSVLGG